MTHIFSSTFSKNDIMPLNVSLGMIWLSLEEAAEHAGVTTRLIRKWIKQEGLKATKIGRTIRIREEDLDSFLLNK